jgi:Glycosyl transferase family 2
MSTPFPAVRNRPDLGDFAWAPRLGRERRERGAPTVGAIIHTRNEERNVADAIRSVGWADHVLVVDMESTDRTVEIAEALGAEVAHHEHTGIVEPARNWSLAHLDTDWVMVLDADERVTEQLARVLDRISSNDEADVVEIHWELWISRQRVERSGWGGHWHNRFFRRGHVRWSDRIHCMPEVTGRVYRMPVDEGTLIHFSYDDLHHFVEKLNRYTGKEADVLAEEPTSDWAWIARFLRREFSWHWTPAHDGTLSGALAMSMLYYRFLSHAKNWERQGFPDVGMPDDPRLALRDIAHDGRILHGAALEAVEGGDLPGATELLRRSVAEQLDVDSLNDLAVLLAQSDHTEEARSLLRTCLVVAPDHADARENLADLGAEDEAGVEVAA